MIGTEVTKGGDALRVLLVEDHAMVAEALRAALDAITDISVIGVGLTMTDGLTMAAARRPEVVVVDYTLPDGEAPDSIAKFRAASPGCAIVVLSASSDYKSVIRALEAGANGYVLKDQRVSELADAIRTVHRGGRALAARLVTTLMDRLSGSGPVQYTLTRREVDVLNLLANGASTAVISTELQLSVNTVRNHVQSVIRRLGAHSKLEAVSIARREGLLDRRTHADADR
jgi:DNA-binding NarL/FixJ family response regulator